MKNKFWHSRILILLILLSFSLVFIGPPLGLADEGMWTFDNPPLKQLKERYGFTPTQEWLDHVRLSSVRFNDGGSGSFVSPNGLVLTNHHVALGQLQKVSSPQKDYVKDGFYAKTQAEEMKCPDLELNVLMSLENVTARVQGAVKPGMSSKEALDARRAEIAKIEKESLAATGLRSDVVALYQGGEYWLYRYKKYTDVRLVFAPEQQIAFFGGDPDNFTYPRYDIDFALFRVYENNKPVQNQHYLKWNTKGAADGELVFVSGHPGSTDRLQTMAQIETLRDHAYPLTLKTLKRRLEVLRRYSAQGTEQARQAAQFIFSIENSLKAYTGQYNGLLDKNLMAKKQKEESEFRALVASKPEWKTEYGDAWDTIAAAEKKQLEMLKPLRFRSLRRSFSRLGDLALAIVQYVAEVKKPDGERLEGFHDAQLESLRFRLFSPAPAYPQMEEVLLADAFQESLEELGPNDPYIKAVLGGRAPAEAARELFTATQLGDPAFRRSLVEGGETAVAGSTDSLIVWARKIDPIVREMRKWQEENVLSVETTAGEKLGKARFAVYGKSAYPDATFTLRLAYGTVKGYPMNGTQAPPKTTFYGLYDRAYSFNLRPPYHLPTRYLERKDRLDLSTPVNFVSTCDIIGGNSGSPVINRNAEFVGVIFDGNIESLVGDFIYDEESNRAVAVHSAVMIETLRKLYDAGALADELEGKALDSKMEDKMAYEAKNFEHLLGTSGFSDQLMKNHFTLYQGYVANTNKLAEALTQMVKGGSVGTPEYAELKRRFGWEFNGMRLHEYYFGNMAKGGKALDKQSAVFKKLTEDFGSYEDWEKDFRASGTTRGIGWVVLYLDPIANKFFNTWINEHDVGHLAGGIPLLVMDVFEHAFMIDYGVKRAEYIEAFFKAIDWGEVVRRFDNAPKVTL